jgi:hypothetical protein
MELPLGRGAAIEEQREWKRTGVLTIEGLGL